MHPVLLKLGPFTVYSYGLMVALGFALATFLACRRARLFGLDKDRVIDLAVFVLLGGIAGARVLYVLLNLSYYRVNMFEALDLTKGGLVWYGGFLSALLVLVWYIKANRIKFWTVVDLLAPYIALGEAFGRIGCFLNGCCYGFEVPPGSPLGIVFPGESAARYPTQIYSAIVLLLIFVILRLWQDRRHFAGEIFLGYCILYSAKRFSIEFLRGDNPRIILGLTISQVISVVVFALAAALFIQKMIRWKMGISKSK